MIDWNMIRSIQKQLNDHSSDINALLWAVVVLVGLIVIVTIWDNSRIKTLEKHDKAVQTCVRDVEHGHAYNANLFTQCIADYLESH